MKKVITFGVFDYFHYGHLMLLEQAKSLGDYLIVAVQENETILKYKPNTTVFYTTEQRVKMINSIKTVDEVVLYKDAEIDISMFDFDIFAVGEDQNHDNIARAISWCEEHGKKVVHLHRTEGISSTIIKEKLKDAN